MMESSLSKNQAHQLSGEDQMSALFANLVIQQTNMALMLLGKVPHPETKETVLEIDSARLIIDQLDMLQVKTKGNLTSQEDGLLKQSLMSLRMTFVEAVEQKTSDTSKAPQPASNAANAGQTESKTEPAPPADEAPRKKFSKTY